MFQLAGGSRIATFPHKEEIVNEGATPEAAVTQMAESVVSSAIAKNGFCNLPC